MKGLFDTIIILDVLLQRSPHSTASSLLMELVNRKRIQGVLCATSITTLHYLATKASDKKKAEKAVRELLQIFEIAPVNSLVLTKALSLRFADFEDAVLHEAGREAGAEWIVTRDRQGFKHASLAIYNPEELLAAISASG